MEELIERITALKDQYQAMALELDGLSDEHYKLVGKVELCEDILNGDVLGDEFEKIKTRHEYLRDAITSLEYIEHKYYTKMCQLQSKVNEQKKLIDDIWKKL